MCQPNIPALSRTPALYRAPELLGIRLRGLLQGLPVVSCDVIGTIEGSITIETALLGEPHCTSKKAMLRKGDPCLEIFLLPTSGPTPVSYLVPLVCSPFDRSICF